MKTICFDIDGTLFDRMGNVRPEVLDMVMAFGMLPDYFVIAWSGGGAGYAETQVRMAGLADLFDDYRGKVGTLRPDIAVDDNAVTLGVTNIQVPLP